MRKISVIGCGWLGLPLAKDLLLKNNIILGTTTTYDKIKILKDSGITPYLLSVNLYEKELIENLFNVDVIILNFPPSRIDFNSFYNFVNEIPKEIKKIIFTSSISVYGEQFGKITEENELIAITENGKKLIQMENILLEKFSDKIVILRLGGLVGNGRHPVKYLAGKNNLKEGELNINLVHLEDCLNIISSFSENNLTGIYNVCEDYHPTKKVFYTKAAEIFNLIPPEFIDSINNSNQVRIISSEKLIKNLNYDFSGNVEKFIL